MLEVRSLCKRFDEKPILRNFNLTLHPGEIVFLTGPSGSGKSTALRAIANLDDHDEGTVLLDGQSADELGYAEWRRDVMYVPQSRIMQNGTPKQLFERALRFRCRSADDEEVEFRAEKYVQLCASVGLERKMVVEQKWGELSGGQAQRAAVMMSIALRPKVLLLDEPSSSCDHQSALMVERAVVEAKIAAVWVTHDLGQPGRVGGRMQSILENGVCSSV